MTRSDDADGARLFTLQFKGATTTPLALARPLPICSRLEALDDARATFSSRRAAASTRWSSSARPAGRRLIVADATKLTKDDLLANAATGGIT
jgi:hypothetical protein